jgi:hypothetical protein
MRKFTLAAAFGALAISAFAAPVFAQGEGLEPGNYTGGPYAQGYTYSYGYTTHPNGGYTYMTNPAPAQVTTYTAPVYVAPTVVPVAPSTTTTYSTSPYGQTTTTYTTTSPTVTYAAPVYAQPSVATTVYVAPRPCNPYDVTRPGVTNACD